MSKLDSLKNFAAGIVGGVLVVTIYAAATHVNRTEVKQQLPVDTLQESVLTSSPVLPATLARTDFAPRNVDLTKAAQMTVDAVVHVKTMASRQGTSYGNPFLDFFFGTPGVRPESAPMRSSGSGVIISADGYIVTNNHVIERSDAIEVTMNDNRSYTARVVGTDPGTDIALLKIEESGLPFLSYGDSDSSKVGEWVLAVGNPFDLTSTVTAGIISAKARNINIINKRYGIESFIQTDAAVNPGNSGGALVNDRGQLIGINTAIASQTGSFTGYSFAVPINIVRKVVSDIMEYGQVQRAVLGLVFSDINAQLADRFDLSTTEGVLVQQTEAGGAAENAGIEAGDVITRIGAAPIRNGAELQGHLSLLSPGQEVKLTLLRGGRQLEKTVVLRNRLGSTATLSRDDTVSLLGADFQSVAADDARKLGIKGGVQIVDIEEGKLMNAGVKRGYIITHINGQQIFRPEDLEPAIGKRRSGGVYVEGLYPNGMRAYYAFGL